jgi:hypothetical protein
MTGSKLRLSFELARTKTEMKAMHSKTCSDLFGWTALQYPNWNNKGAYSV